MHSVARGSGTSVAEVARRVRERIGNARVRIVELDACMDHVSVYDRRERVQLHSRVLGDRTGLSTLCAATHDNLRIEIAGESIGGTDPERRRIRVERDVLPGRIRSLVRDARRLHPWSI